MKKKYLIFSLIIVSLLFLTFFTISFYKNTRFIQAKPKYDNIVESVYGLGEIKSHTFFDFKSTVSQTLTEIYVKEGDFIKKDTPLFKTFQNQVFRSPINGTVTNLPFHKMENIPAQQSIIEIVDLSDIYIEVSLEQNAALRIKKGELAKISLESFRGKVYTGKVSALFPKNGEFIVQISLDSMESSVLPGMTVDVVIEVGKKKNALLIPYSAVDSGKVWRIRNDKKEKVKVAIGYTDGIWAEIQNGDIKISDTILIPKTKRQRK